jgi:hypothetical protein
MPPLVDSLLKIYRADTLGAVCSVVMLGFVIPSFQNYFGMNVEYWYFLAMIASILLVHSFFWCVFFPTKPVGLLWIAILNLVYTGLSTGILWMNWYELKPLGLAYLVSEKVIVFALVLLELKIYLKSRKAAKL